MSELKFKVNSLGQTKRLAHQIASNLKGGEVLCLMGELGVGKTYFVKFFAEALGIKGEEVISPTFVYWRKHEGTNFRLNHFDFYRLDNADEMDDIGLDEALGEKKSVSIIEWADRVQERLPGDRVDICIEFLGESERQFKISSTSKKCNYLLKGVKLEAEV